ncbi:hypothetical protein PCE1_003948 [Barthelona sp. PCE]
MTFSPFTHRIHRVDINDNDDERDCTSSHPFYYSNGEEQCAVSMENTSMVATVAVQQPNDEELSEASVVHCELTSEFSDFDGILTPIDTHASQKTAAGYNFDISQYFSVMEEHSALEHVYDLPTDVVDSFVDHQTSVTPSLKQALNMPFSPLSPQ